MLNVRIGWGRFVFDLDCGLAPEEEPEEVEEHEHEVSVTNPFGFSLPEPAGDPVFRNQECDGYMLPHDPLDDE